MARGQHVNAHGVCDVSTSLQLLMDETVTNNKQQRAWRMVNYRNFNVLWNNNGIVFVWHNNGIVFVSYFEISHFESFN